MRAESAKLILGTAMWGWRIDASQAFALADLYYELGGRWFDTAANYPINKSAEDFGVAESILSCWLKSRGWIDVHIIDKFGAVSNDGSDASDLSPSALSRQYERACDLFGDNLTIASVHWDNRTDIVAVEETVQFFRDLHGRNLSIGLSGIREPECYLKAAPDLAAEWHIQIKNNPAEQTAYRHYRAFHGTRRFLAYGINGGGYRPNSATYTTGSVSLRGGTRVTDAIANRAIALVTEAGFPTALFNDASMTLSAANPDIEGIIISPSSDNHMREAFACRQSWSSEKLVALGAKLANL